MIPAAWIEVHFMSGLWCVTVCAAKGGSRVTVTAEWLHADALALARMWNANSGLPVHDEMEN